MRANGCSVLFVLCSFKEIVQDHEFTSKMTKENLLQPQLIEDLKRDMNERAIKIARWKKKTKIWKPLRYREPKGMNFNQ